MRIGDFARLGQVSVRMLRHYESLGLLLPDDVDRFTGRRSYSVAQLSRLNRIMALNTLGIPLRKLTAMLDSDLDTEQLAEMLRLRRHQLRADREDIAAKLADVDFRLALIERNKSMEHLDCVVKELPAERILGSTVVLGEPPFDSSQIGPLFRGAAEQIAEAGAKPGVGVGLYTGADSTGTEVTCGFRCTGAEELAARPECAGLSVTTLPACTAATLVHEGPMSHIAVGWQHLTQWCADQGFDLAGPCREVYLETGDGSDDPADQSGWVVELQQPIVRNQAAD
ncbi:MerR family transcriptional regulator [Brevibacterium sp.]|uniref:MerR family transcriptional regulator n=1 Tax=Brevibacterium sp. TaxID=1701 RepID=UPI002811EA0D|nr:MerR family transcriptional regulator [Brevibacterium sp.]